jgi:hypothetical protein
MAGGGMEVAVWFGMEVAKRRCRRILGAPSPSSLSLSFPFPYPSLNCRNLDGVPSLQEV